jgi:hypothetical protein
MNSLPRDVVETVAKKLSLADRAVMATLSRSMREAVNVVLETSRDIRVSRAGLSAYERLSQIRTLEKLELVSTPHVPPNVVDWTVQAFGMRESRKLKLRHLRLKVDREHGRIPSMLLSHAIESFPFMETLEFVETSGENSHPSREYFIDRSSPSLRCLRFEAPGAALTFEKGAETGMTELETFVYDAAFRWNCTSPFPSLNTFTSTIHRDAHFWAVETGGQIAISAISGPAMNLVDITLPRMVTYRYVLETLAKTRIETCILRLPEHQIVNLWGGDLHVDLLEIRSRNTSVRLSGTCFAHVREIRIIGEGVEHTAEYIHLNIRAF